MKGELKYTLENRDPSERKRFIRKTFDTIVPTYDLLNRILSLGIDMHWRRFAAKKVDNIRGQSLLDLCCGTGDFTRVFRKKGAEVTSLDFSLPMLQKGTTKTNLAQAVAADASQLPFRDESFAILSIAFGIRNIPDLTNFISETYRVLKKGGVLVILELTRPRFAVLRFIHRIYLQTLVPLLGRVISGRSEAYRYLPGTIVTFVDPNALEEMFLRGGYTRTDKYYKTFGTVTVLICRK